MSTTSRKHSDFVVEPMGEKPVTDLAGIGEILGKRLVEAGFDKAYTVFGQFLILKKDDEKFKKWIKDTCNANSKEAADCYQCLSNWCEDFLSGQDSIHLIVGPRPLRSGLASIARQGN